MKPGNDEEIPTVLGAGSHFEGLLTFRGAARVDGSISGTIHATGRLWIGPEAHVQAQIDVDELVVEGLVEGDVRAHTRAELTPTGRVIGDLFSPQFKMAEGGVLEGRCRTTAPDHHAESGEDSQAPDSVAEFG